MRTSRNPLAQAIFACAVICLLALQSFAGATLHRTSSETTAAIAQAADEDASRVICEKVSDHDQPVQDGHHQTQCCAFCPDQTADAAALSGAAKLIAILTPEEDARCPYNDAPPSGIALSGWKSAWSSTAPPRA